MPVFPLTGHPRTIAHITNLLWEAGDLGWFEGVLSMPLDRALRWFGEDAGQVAPTTFVNVQRLGTKGFFSTLNRSVRSSIQNRPEFTRTDWNH